MTVTTPKIKDKSTREPNRWSLLGPCVLALFIWMIVPLSMTIYFSFRRYNLLSPQFRGFAGVDNYSFLLSDQTIYVAIFNTLVLISAVVTITIIVGTMLAVVFDQEFAGHGIARLIVTSPFFIMPTVAALIWKNLLMHPINGVFAWVAKSLGANPVDWFSQMPMISLIIIVAWQWIPFATLILITAMQSLDREQLEAARMDGARGVSLFRFVTLPHLLRPIAIVVMIEAIFLYSIFAEILVTTGGGPGTATTNLTYFIYRTAILQWDIGAGSAAGIFAIIIANMMVFGLVVGVARNFNR